ncbi:hypothetical protein KQH49_13370 [Mycetohabitans sp. B5]|uniref:hypothetical protein n=1 Tax=Mycetohabitans sp. B5 TaxID=2841846 RepID=UPI001F259624|nr:hypothetical protein [Mycetohabitans sp. B5]MCG1055861.1 hypothetical protein [Mycetohabitans sp. B5]
MDNILATLITSYDIPPFAARERLFSFWHTGCYSQATACCGRPVPAVSKLVHAMGWVHGCVG